MNMNAAEPNIFQERLAQYLQYIQPATAESDILQVKLHFLSEGQEKRVREVVGLVRSGETRPPEPAA
jgi:hypothetical protein